MARTKRKIPGGDLRVIPNSRDYRVVAGFTYDPGSSPEANMINFIVYWLTNMN